MSATSAMVRSFVKLRGQRLSAGGVEQREPVRPQREPNGFADENRLTRRQSRLQLAVGRVHGDDLRGTEIFGANHATAQPRGIGERYILGPHAERELALGTILEYFRHFALDAVDQDIAIAAAQRRLDAEKRNRWRE